MSAYFESLNRRVSATKIPAKQATVRIPAPDQVGPVHPVPPARINRLVPGAVPAVYARLRERLIVAAKGRAIKAMVFAGCEGGEGCTEVVRDFAESLASSGLNVLLVDGDLRTASLTAGLVPGGADLVDVVRSRSVPAAVPWGTGKLTVVGSSGAVADKESFLRSAELAAWLDDQRMKFDYTLVDSAPILRYADGVLAGVFTDGLVLVARAGVTRGVDLARARQQIERAGGVVLGVVLNQAQNPIPPFLRHYLANTD